jgi:hypothetical protein
VHRTSVDTTVSTDASGKGGRVCVGGIMSGVVEECVDAGLPQRSLDLLERTAQSPRRT